MIDKETAKAVQSRIVHIREVMLMKYPFFGELAMKLKIGAAHCETAYTDMDRIVFDPDFIADMDDKQLLFLYMHELMHCVLLHPVRGIGKLHWEYNIACDIVVNSNILDYMGEKEIEIAGSYAMHLSPSGREGRVMTAEEVYEELMRIRNVRVRSPKETEGGQGIGSGGSGGSGMNPMDDHKPWGSIDDPGEKADRMNKDVLEIAGKYGAPGGCPQAVLAILEDEKMKAKLKWKDLLRDFVESNTFLTDYSFAPPDRRFSDGDYLLPAENVFPDEEVQNIWFCVDCSGSIGIVERSWFLTEIRGLLEQFTYCHGLLSYFDTGVTPPESFSNLEELKRIVPVGGGGTSFWVIFKYMQEHMAGNLPKAIVILTDGFAPDVEEREACGVPVLWLLTTPDMEMSWGRTVHIDIER